MLRIFVALCVALATVNGQDCMDGKEWVECGSPCDATCDDPMPLCAAVCVARCQCPGDSVLNRETGKCQKHEDCPSPKARAHAATHPCEGVDCGEGKICREDFVTSNGYKIGRCVDKSLPEFCQMPMDPGPCRAIKPRWFYNGDLGTCSKFNYGGCRGNVNRFMSEEECGGKCITMDWVDECPPIDCMMECKNGRKNDDKGCELCECLADECPLNTCYMECPNGFLKDKKGCNVCQCADLGPKANSMCTPVMCDMECDYGFKKDKNGCDRCECTVENECSAIMCMMECSNGFKRDKRGCDICECAPECSEVMCMMECPNGFKKDLYGCQTCECAPECSAIMCSMECPNGFKEDQFGCAKCECAPEVDEKEVGCSDVMCLMECPFGFKKDKQGCELCECAQKSKSMILNCPEPETECMMFCEFGFKRDGKGCPQCECARKREGTCSGVMCDMYCEYGFTYDLFGCQNCECANNPCDEMDCYDNSVCKIFENDMGRFNGVCVPSDLRDWCVGSPMCTLYCEHGFSNDMYGCPECECLEEPKGECPEVKCDGGCEYGYSYDKLGCRQCDCLPDPCESKICYGKPVCEAKHILDCPTCPSRAKCLDESEVKRVHIFMQFVHEPLEELDEEAFTTTLRERIAELLSIDPEYVREVEVSEKSVVTTSVNFHLVENGNPDGLITTYKDLKDKVDMHDDGTAVEYENIQFIPEHESLAAHYSSDINIPEKLSDDDSESDMTQLIIIIAVAAGVAVFVIVLTVIVVTMLKNKGKKGKMVPHDNVKYQQFGKESHIYIQNASTA